MQIAPATEQRAGTGPTPAGTADDQGAVRAIRRAARALATAALHARHRETADHSDEVVELCQALADELGVAGDAREELLAAAELHDVGKLAIGQEILEKPGPLDAVEWEAMRQHTVVGERILLSVPEMAEVARLVRHAHERWDGTGYPDGVAGEDIPLASRVIFCADAFHAIRSDRPYRAGLGAREALAEITAHAGTQFDPSVARALVRIAGHARESRSWPRFSPRALVLLLTLGLSATALAVAPELREGIISAVGAAEPAPAPAPAPVQREQDRVVPAPKRAAPRPNEAVPATSRAAPSKSDKGRGKADEVHGKSGPLTAAAGATGFRRA